VPEVVVPIPPNVLRRAPGDLEARAEVEVVEIKARCR